MSIKGGYKILDFSGYKINTNSGIVKVIGIYDKIEESCGKSILISGILENDFFATVEKKNDNYEIRYATYVMKITTGDNVTVVNTAA